MPADRLLHPRAGRSHKVNLLTDLEYRVWTQYLLSADDFGVMHATSHALQNDNLHLAHRPAKVVTRCLEALIKSGLVRRFEHQGQPYVFQHDWQKWQKVEYPRATINPCPSGADLDVCDPATRDLFEKHPGGQRKVTKAKDVPSDSERASRIHPEGIPPTRAGAPAERLTANGLRLPAHGLEGGAGETAPPADLWFEDLKAAYPPQSVSSGHLTMTAFVDVILSRGTPLPTFTAMMANLESQKRGHQWRVKGMVPKLEKWLREGLWEQQHDERAPVAEQLSNKTNRTLAGAAEILNGRAS